MYLSIHIVILIFIFFLNIKFQKVRCVVKLIQKKQGIEEKRMKKIDRKMQGKTRKERRMQARTLHVLTAKCQQRS